MQPLCLVIEEANVDYINANHDIKSSWKVYCNTENLKIERFWDRVGFNKNFINKIHLIMFSRVVQFTYYWNLHINTHYTLSSGEKVNELLRYCTENDYRYKLYFNDTDYYHCDEITPIVINLNHNKEYIMGNIHAQLAYKLLNDKKCDYNFKGELAGH